MPMLGHLAAKGLGHVGTQTGDSAAITPLLNYLEKALHNIETSSDIDYPVLTEVVLGIGQVQSDQSLINCGSLMTRLRK